MKIEFTPKTHFVIQDWNWYHLANRIDRSYKWKVDDIGIEYIFLTKEQVEECRKEGFTFIK
jgi:hypothetical protein